MDMALQYRRANAFTPEMRDRQARGKDPYARCDGSDDSDGSVMEERMRLGRRSREETFREKELKGEAMSILDNPELLMAHAHAAGDSIAGQRLRFMRQLCGFEEHRVYDPSFAKRKERERLADARERGAKNWDAGDRKGRERQWREQGEAQRDS